MGYKRGYPQKEGEGKEEKQAVWFVNRNMASTQQVYGGMFRADWSTPKATLQALGSSAWPTGFSIAVACPWPCVQGPGPPALEEKRVCVKDYFRLSLEQATVHKNC